MTLLINLWRWLLCWSLWESCMMSVREAVMVGSCCRRAFRFGAHTTWGDRCCGNATLGSRTMRAMFCGFAALATRSCRVVWLLVSLPSLSVVFIKKMSANTFNALTVLLLSSEKGACGVGDCSIFTSWCAAAITSSCAAILRKSQRCGINLTEFVIRSSLVLGIYMQ